MEVKIEYLYNQFLALDPDTRTGFEQIGGKVAQLEEWYVNDGQPAANDEEELVAAPSSPEHSSSHVTHVVANPTPFPPSMDPLISILGNPNSTAAIPVGVGCPCFRSFQSRCWFYPSPWEPFCASPP